MNIINVDKIKKSLKTNFLGQNIIYKEQMESTQDVLIDLDKNANLPDGSYVICDVQTKGRGTHGRKWLNSSYENICGSFVLKPNCDVKKIEHLTKLIAECLVETISNLYSIELSIKEPNDVICNGKKIAGILTQSVTVGEEVKKIYVGIGIDVNQEVFDDEIKDIATSLKREYGKEFSREEIIANFFNKFEEKYIEMIEK